MSNQVLIVDDALFMRAMLRKIIAPLSGVGVIEAEDGPSAVEKYKAERPGLVLLDISMPGMNGIEVLKAIRAFDENARVVMCSAIGQENMIMEAVQSGAMDFIVKPFKPEQIVEAVQSAFSGGDAPCGNTPN